MSGFRRRLMMLPSEEDVYVLNNAVLLSDGTVLLADDGTPVAYAGQNARLAGDSTQAQPADSNASLYSKTQKVVVNS